MSIPGIQHLQRNEIDDASWNNAVASDPANLIYGFSWWLDAASDGHWTGIVLGDYQAVLALPYYYKGGLIKVLARPPFTQQLGPWGNASPVQIYAMLEAIPKSAIQIKLSLSENTTRPAIPDSFRLQERMNMILPIEKSYPEIFANYGSTLRRRLRKTGPLRLEHCSIDAIMDLYRQTSGSKAGLKTYHYERARAVLEACQNHHAGLYLEGYDSHSNELLVRGFFPVYRNRVINLFPAATPEGYRKDGTMRMLDAVIQRYAGKDKAIMDFEGSDLPGIAQFFKRFYPLQVTYPQISRDRIPAGALAKVASFKNKLTRNS